MPSGRFQGRTSRCTAETTIQFVRRLATHHSDTTIANLLNRQRRKKGTTQSLTASGQASLRQGLEDTHHQPRGQLCTIGTAADQIGLAASAPVVLWMDLSRSEQNHSISFFV